MIKRIFFFVLLVSAMLVPLALYPQSKLFTDVEQKQKAVDFPEVPRVSAQEAYIKFKSGKAIIIQAGGSSYKNKHIMGALDINAEAVQRGKIKLRPLPKKGVEIFTYCY